MYMTQYFWPFDFSEWQKTRAVMTFDKTKNKSRQIAVREYDRLYIVEYRDAISVYNSLWNVKTFACNLKIWMHL